jgi:vanillate monooxygenase ferredoxin subunit
MKSFLTAAVARVTPEAEGIVVLELADPTGAELPPFSAGSHIDVEVAPGLVRPYSLCNNPADNRRYAIGVLQEPASRGGSAGMLRLRVGDTVRISEPRNHFPLDGSAPFSLLFAGGIGVTPILCMAERLATVGAAFEMHYAARSREKCAFHGRITRSAFADRVSFYFTDAEPPGILDAGAIIERAGPDVHVYVCGPPGFIEFVLEAAAAKGLPDHQLHREYFAPSETAARGDSGAFEIKLASTGQVLAVPADQTVMAVLRQHGVELEASCEEGVCGTCLTRIVEGVPDHRDVFLTTAERERNDCFLPCCSRAKTPLLVLDI